MKKKLVTSILALTLALSLTACGGKDKAETSNNANIAQSEAPADTEEAATDDAAADDGAESAIVEVPVTIVNGTGVDIYALYMFGSGVDEWSEDLLGEQTMPHGTYLEMVLNVDQNNLAWDLSVEDSEGTTLEWYGLDISEMPLEGFGIELLWDGTEGTANIVEDASMLEGDYTSASSNTDTAAAGGEEMDVAVVSEAVAGTIWVDDGGTVWGFGEDGITLNLAYSDGEEVLEASGEYALPAAENGVVALSMIVPDLEIAIDALLTGITDTFLEFTDINTGESTVLTPYTE